MSIKLKGSTDGSVTLQAPADTSPTGTDKTFTLPTQDGDAGQILKTDGSGALSFTDNLASNRNLIINGAMRVAQRGTSATVSNNSNEGYQTLDRFGFVFASGAGGGCTISQSTDAPSNQGFSNSYKVDVTTSDTSLAASHYIGVYYNVESQDIRNSGWNYTNSSSYVTLSFWVKSSKAGTYCAHVRNEDVSCNYYTFEYTLVADTWTKITKSIPGDSSVVFNNDNGAGLRVTWILAAGTDRDNATANQWQIDCGAPATSNQVNFFDSTSNDFYLTGVQLEVGEVATAFEHKSYDEVHAACDRYTQVFSFDSQYEHIAQGIVSSANEIQSEFQLRKMMRAFPSMTLSDISHFRLNDYRGNDEDASTNLGVFQGHLGMVKINLRKATSNMDQGRAGYINVSTSAGGNCKITFSAEL